MLATVAMAASASIASAQSDAGSTAALLSDASSVLTHVEGRTSAIGSDRLNGLFVVTSDTDENTDSTTDSPGEVAYGTMPSDIPTGVDPMTSGGGGFAFDVFGVDLENPQDGNTYNGESKPSGRTIAAPMPSPLTMGAAGLLGVGLVSRRRG